MSRTANLALNLGYSAGDFTATAKIVQEAEALGYGSFWVAESWGSDAVSVLAYVAALTKTIDVGSAIMQIPARTPAMTAMTAATLDNLSHGRFRLGLGLSGPQVSEGWHGVRYAKPLGRQREYVEIVQKALTRAKLSYDGEHFTLPLPDGPGKALHLMIHPVREHIPTYLAAVGPKNLELAGEIADGWLGIFPETEHLKEQVASVLTGRTKIGKTMEGFDVCPTIPAAIGDDVQAMGDPIKAYVALYVGGMGSREQNFYNQQARRMGFEAEAENIQDLYLSRKQGEAVAAVPFDLVDRTSLVGPVDRVADRMLEFVEAGVTTFSIAPFGAPEAISATLRGVSEAAQKAGLLA